MNSNTFKTISIQLINAAALACLAWSAHAQTSATSAAKKAAPVAKKAPSSAATMAAAPASAMLSAEQRGIALIVTTGRINCDDGKHVTITPDARVEGAFDLVFAGVKYDVTPKPTTTGAVRLEDPKSGIVFMQLANKSMLFNEKQSRRLADDCITPAQQAVADQMLANPTAGVLDSPAK